MIAVDTSALMAVVLNEPLADACFEDRSRLCEGVQPVGATPLL